jgi:hypothetical protein
VSAVGDTALTLIRSLPSSFAHVFVNPTMPIFAAA